MQGAMPLAGIHFHAAIMTDRRDGCELKKISAPA